MIFHVYPAGVFQANCYIIADENTLEGAVVDPGGDPEGILGICKKLNLNVKYIILTHGHGDHIAGVWKIKQETGAKILMNSKDEYLTDGGTKELIPILRDIRLFDIDEYINEGDVINLGNIRIEVLETPGHTLGSVSLKMGNIVLTGDALFQGSVGRTDFPKSSHEELIRSIKEKILTLPDDTVVYPGHGPSTTVGDEKRYNPFL
ncbi:MBL fold metallo-hydrolase [Fonticella tunisiensis]|uniref:Glyoxylase-like metal-dependent hydrolase (Beta-lactamase superfamily II) n=1 Tax=Fonticella tunisiensis TaxID=1096341 RepID=A0A4R7K7M9_9CLOT|nr:MBL fold metallo-hydrolase [Fonticella tunisiensis]TDT45974.1 glyoxylase-like metal-dependent hydrolase (beta-lactamase superfamily II) [Fonticella tunisiensis]